VNGPRMARAVGWDRPRIERLGWALALAAGLLLIRLPWMETTILLGLLALAVATLVEPLAGVIGGLFLGLMRAYLQTEVPQIPAQIGHLFVALALASWIARSLRHRTLRIPSTPLLLPLLGFVAAAWLSLWDGAGLASHGVPELIKWIELLLVFLLVADRARPQDLRWLLAAVLLVAAFQAMLGLYQFSLRGEGPEHFLIPGSDFYRAYGTFEQPNPYAGYIGMSLALALGTVGGMAASKPGAWRSRALWACGLCTVLLAAALGISWSRGAWIGFVTALGAMAISIPRRAGWGLLLVAVLGIALLALFAAGAVPASITARLTDFTAGLRLEDVRGVGINDANYAVIERLAHWQTALQMWRAHFWTGVGFGGYEAAYPHFALINWPVALGHAHNIYLNLLAESGLIGLAAYLTLWGIVFWTTWQLTRHTTGLSRGASIGLLGVWTHLSVHQFFDNLYVNNVHLFIGLLLAFLVTVRKAQNEVSQSLDSL